MANVRTLKVTARQAAFAVVGSGTATISAYDMVHSRQTLDAANAVYTISDIAYDVNNSSNITRGGNLVFACNAGQNELNFTDSIGAVLNDKSSSNVIVNLGASEGTIIIQFSKGDGFIDPDRQNQGPGSL
jgi:hypothetical protein